MKKLCFLILFSINFIIYVQAANWFTPNSESKDVKGYCFDSANLLLIRVGETKLIKEKCHWSHCSSDFTLIGSSCGSFAGSNPSCVEWGTDVYPNCCKPICLKYSEEDEEE